MEILAVGLVFSIETLDIILKIPTFCVLSVFSLILSYQYLKKEDRMDAHEFLDIKFSPKDAFKELYQNELDKIKEKLTLETDSKKEAQLRQGAKSKAKIKMGLWFFKRITVILGLLVFLKAFFIGFVLIFFIFVFITQAFWEKGTFFDRKFIVDYYLNLYQSEKKQSEFLEKIESYKKSSKAGKFLKVLTFQSDSKMQKKIENEEEWQQRIQSRLIESQELIEQTTKNLEKIQEDLRPKEIFNYTSLIYNYFDQFSDYIFFITLIVSLVYIPGDLVSVLLGYFSVSSITDDLILGLILFFLFTIIYQISPQKSGNNLKIWYQIISNALYLEIGGIESNEAELHSQIEFLESQNVSIPKEYFISTKLAHYGKVLLPVLILMPIILYLVGSFFIETAITIGFIFTILITIGFYIGLSYRVKYFRMRIHDDEEIKKKTSKLILENYFYLTLFVITCYIGYYIGLTTLPVICIGVYIFMLIIFKVFVGQNQKIEAYFNTRPSLLRKISGAIQGYDSLFSLKSKSTKKSSTAKVNEEKSPKVPDSANPNHFNTFIETPEDNPILFHQNIPTEIPELKNGNPIVSNQMNEKPIVLNQIDEKPIVSNQMDKKLLIRLDVGNGDCAICGKTIFMETILICPYCDCVSHLEHLKEWLKFRNYRPNCKNHLDLSMIEE